MPFQADHIGQPPSRILLATDLIDLKQTLPDAIEYAAKFHAELRLVHALPDVDPALSFRASRTAEEHAANGLLKQAIKTATMAGVQCSPILRIGSPAEIIRQVVREWNPDRVIVGSHGPRKFQQKILGSVAESVFRELDVPVIAVGPAANRNPWLPDRKARFLFATALDRGSQLILDWVLACTRIQEAELTLLHVIPETAKAHPAALRVHAYAERMCEEMLAHIGNEASRPHCIIERGQVVETILRIAKQSDFHLIFLGPVSGSAFRGDIMPGTAYGVVCGAPCPVEVLKGDPLLRAGRWQAAS